MQWVHEDFVPVNSRNAEKCNFSQFQGLMFAGEMEML